MRIAGLLAASALLLVSCGELKSPTEPGAGGGVPDPSATFRRVQSEIFTPTCAKIGCHSEVGTQQGLVLSAGASYASTVGHPSSEMVALLRVSPGDPAGSYLYRKVTGAGISGERMPLGGPYLTDPQLALLRDWIRRGAPND